MPPKEPRRDSRPAASPTPAEDPTQRNGSDYRTSSKVEAKLNPYIDAHQKDLAYYERLIAENPERAARSLMLKDLEMHEEKMKRVMRQLPNCKEFYEGLTPEKKAKIDATVAAVNPYHETQAFVGECIAEYNRQNYGKLFGKKNTEEVTESAGMAAG